MKNLVRKLCAKRFGSIARTPTYRYDRRSEVKTLARERKFMTAEPVRESIQVSLRFRSTIEATILELERNAALDERFLATLRNPDHRRRQRLLIEKQLDKAFRLREMLALMSVRLEPRRRERAA
jgi:hypothetical protein